MFGKKIIKFLCICLLYLFSAALVHASEDSPFYISAKFVSAFSDIDEISNSGAITGSPFNSETDDVVGGFSGGIGYQWNQFRFEIEYLWRYRFDYGVQFPNGTPPTSISADVETHSVLANVKWDFKNTTKFTPYVGAGVGWAGHEADTSRRNLITSAVANIDTTTDNFIWTLGLGINYRFTTAWNVHLVYRYFDLGDVEVGPYPDGAKVDAEYSSHDLAIGVSYNF